VVFQSDTTVATFGMGEYLGLSIPGEQCLVGLMEAIEGTEVPHIRLDSGEDVWGCETQFGTEEGFLEFVGERRLHLLDINKVRAKFKRHIDNQPAFWEAVERIKAARREQLQ
jgi:hypothetical protein